MSQAAPDLPDDVRRRIDDHLDAIELVLLRGNVRARNGAALLTR